MVSQNGLLGLYRGYTMGATREGAQGLWLSRKTVAIRHGRLTLQMFMAGFITSRTKLNCPGPGFLFSFCSDLEFQTLVVLLEYMLLWS